MLRRGCRAALLSAALALACAGHAGDAASPVEAYLAAWNGAPERLDAALAPQFVDRSALLPGDAQALKRFIAHWRQAVPDLRVSLLEQVSSPGTTVLRVRYAGHPADPAAIVPLSGGAIAIERTEWLRIAEGRITELRARPDEWTLPPELAFVAPPALPAVSLPARTLASFAPGTFLESIAVGPDGRLYLSTGPEGGIVAVAGDGRIAPFARIDVGPGGLMMCLAFDAAGRLYASVISARPEVHGVWRFARNGSGTRLAALPPGSTPNGIAHDGRGALLVADAFGGLIWRVRVEDGSVSEWLRSPLLAPRPLVGEYPGANGLQRAGEAVFVTVSDRSLALRIPLLPGGAAGSPRVVSGTVAGDDFAIAPGGTLYVTTHPFNTVVRLGPGGAATVVAGPAQGVIGPTAAALGPDGALYVVTDGGLYRPLAGVPLAPALVRIELPR